MGICNSVNQKESEFLKEKTNKGHFTLQQTIGKGGRCKVRKAKHKQNLIDFAIKEISKVTMLEKDMVKNILLERDLLVRINHPFIIGLQYAFEDHEKLYLVLDYLKGGDLRYHLSRSLFKKVDEVKAKFFIGCIILALEYLHSNKIIHRDVKPENMVFDEEGYLRLTDLGISSFISKENPLIVSGTPGYISPEILEKLPHDFTTDYYSLGVVLYEFVYGKKPYQGKTVEEIQDQMETLDINIKKIPAGWSSDTIELINQLCKRNPDERLGKNGIYEIKNHKWFEDFEWEMLYKKNIGSPFIPEGDENYDKDYCSKPLTINYSTYARLLAQVNKEYDFSKFNFNREKENRSVQYFTNPHELNLNEIGNKIGDFEKNCIVKDSSKTELHDLTKINVNLS